MKEIKPKIMVKFDEYISIWVDLIYESFLSSEKALENKLELGDSNKLNLIAFLNLLATSSLQEHSKMSKSIFTKVSDGITEKLVLIMSNNDAEKSEVMQVSFKSRIKEFETIINMFSQKMSGDELITSFSRLILDIKDSKKESIENISSLASELLTAKITFDKLSRNSGVSMKIVGQPSFIVQKD